MLFAVDNNFPNLGWRVSEIKNRDSWSTLLARFITYERTSN